MSQAWVGSIPSRIAIKAKAVMAFPPPNGSGWKKISSSKNCFSFRLNNKFRVLCWRGRDFIVCDHDTYERKIKTIRKQQGQHADRV